MEGGDFSIANKSPQAQVPEGQPQYGDPRWSTWAAGDSYITTSFNMNMGSVLADKVYANEGTLITVAVTPAEGYDLESFTVTDQLGNSVPVSTAALGAARTGRMMVVADDAVAMSFMMPATDVTVVATFIEEGTVGIENVTANAQNENGKWYTVSGTLVEKPTKGVYIHNNKKVVVR